MSKTASSSARPLLLRSNNFPIGNVSKRFFCAAAAAKPKHVKVQIPMYKDSRERIARERAAEEARLANTNDGEEDDVSKGTVSYIGLHGCESKAQIDESVKNLMILLELAQKEGTDAPIDPMAICKLHVDLAHAFHAGRDLEQAVYHYRDAVDLLEKQEKTKDNQFRLSRVLNDLSMVLSECEMFDDALQMAKRAMRLRRRSVGTDHVSICECLNNMGAIYLSRGRFNRAAENFEDAIKVLISGGPEEDPHVAMAYYNLGSTNLFHYCVSFFDFVGCGMLTTSSTWTHSSWPFGADAGSSFSRPGGHQVARSFCMVCI